MDGMNRQGPPGPIPPCDSRHGGQPLRASVSSSLRPFLIYVAGAYRAATEWEVRKNIERSADRAAEVWRLNPPNAHPWVMAVAPCLNTAFFGGVVRDEVFLACDLELLRRCDAMIVADGADGSEGVMREIRFARDHGIPALANMKSLVEWLDEAEARRRRDAKQDAKRDHSPLQGATPVLVSSL